LTKKHQQLRILKSIS